MIDVKIITKPKNSTGGASGSGGGIIAKTAENANHATTADKATSAEFAEQVEYADRAGYSSRSAYADAAGDLAEDSPANDRFLSSLKPDTAQGIIQFLAGLGVGEKYGITADGAATLETISAERLHDKNSTSADRVATGAQGYDIYMGEDGKSYAYLDNIIVRQKAVFNQTEIRKVSYAGGSVIYSNAGSTIVKVVNLFDENGQITAYKCYAKADDGTTQTSNWWLPGMMALCQTFNVTNDGNRYYWRLVVGTGYETLEDGKRYYYVVLSNKENFRGSDAVIPAFGEGVFSEEKGNLLTWGDGSAMVAITTAEANISLADVCYLIGIDTDEDGRPIADRNFVGYDYMAGIANDNPMAGDVIVQVGSQIQWYSLGNVVAIRTSAEDDSSHEVPSITMYHGLGKFYKYGDLGGTYPYQWKTRTSMQCPEQWIVSAERFFFFTGDDEGNMENLESFFKLTTEEIALKVNKADMLAAGMDITEDTVVLTATQTKIRNQKGEDIAVFNADGTVTAGTLESEDTGYGKISITGGEMSVINPQGLKNIQFGLSADGYMVLRYYDNNGNLLYDLGPSGLTAQSTIGQRWEQGDFASVENNQDYITQWLWSNGTWNASAPTSSSIIGRQYIKAMGNLDVAAFSTITDETSKTETSPEGTQPRWEDNGFTKTTLYKYYAAKVNGTALKDDDAGLTAQEAAYADGRWFTQKTGLGGGSEAFGLQHTAEGAWLPWTGKVLAGLVDAAVGRYPTYRLSGMFSTVIGAEQPSADVVSDSISKAQTIITASEDE